MSTSTTNTEPETEIDIVYPEAPTVYFIGIEEYEEEIDHEKAIMVSISFNPSISLARYIPLVKPVSFSSSVSYDWNYEYRTSSGSTSYSSSGSVTTDGMMYAYGLTAGKTVHKNIMNTIKEKIKEEVMKNVNKELGAVQFR